MSMGNILEVKNLHVSFKSYAGTVKAVRGVDFVLGPQQTLAMVGESGCGKTVTAKSILRLFGRTSGEISKDSSILFHDEELLNLNKRKLSEIRGGKISMIFQDSMTSLNPTMRVGKQIAECIRLHNKISREEAMKKACDLLRLVEIPNPEERLKNFPHQMSGGMRQRVMIAMALSCNPEVLIADEPTTALDVTIQAQLIDLLRSLRERMGMSVILVTHDLGVVADFADYIQVMYAGQIVERGTKEEIFKDPKHPYTWALLDSIPNRSQPRKSRLYSLKGTPPNLLLPIEGCPFAARCRYCMPVCKKQAPPETSFSDSHRVNCWLNHPMAPKDVRKGEGAVLIDRQGERYLDLDEMCVFLGQGNQHFTDTVTEALQGITNGRASTVDYKQRLTQQLMDTTDHLFEAVHFTSSGSEAVEWAVRLAKKLTGRSEIISFWNSIHGRTYLSASMSGLPKRKAGYAPLAPGLVYGVYPDCQHCPLDKKPENCNFFCLDFLEKKVRYESAQDIAAVIIEPYQGAGIVIPPEGYFQRLQEWARKNGILLIMDEIQAGLGRTGSLYCYQQLGIQPDMLLLGKGLGNGLHISALLTRQVPESSCLGAVSGGTGDDCVACAAACAVLDEVSDPDYLSRIRAASQRLSRGLEELSRQYSGISRFRVWGLAAAIEFDSPETGKEVGRQMAEKHFLFGKMGDQMMVLKPPLCLTEEQVSQFLEGLQQSLQH